MVAALFAVVVAVSAFSLAAFAVAEAASAFCLAAATSDFIVTRSAAALFALVKESLVA